MRAFTVEAHKALHLNLTILVFNPFSDAYGKRNQVFFTTKVIIEEEFSKALKSKMLRYKPCTDSALSLKRIVFMPDPSW